MKNIKYLFIITFTIILFGNSSCETTDLDLTDNPNALTPDGANPDFLLNRMQIDLSSFFTATTSSTMRLVRMQYLFQSYPNLIDNTTLNDTRVSGAVFDTWTIAYRINNNFLLLEELTEGNQFLTKHRAVSRLIRAYTFVTLSDLVGDLPLSQAGNIVEFPNPILDDDETVYNDMFNLIDMALVELNNDDANTIQNDLFYNGDTSKWIKFANTLKLKMYNQISSFDAPRATDGINALLLEDNLIETKADDFQFNYTDVITPDSRHSSFVNYEGGGAAGTTYMSNSFMSLLKDSNIQDPRLRYYFYRQTNDAPPAVDTNPCVVLTGSISDCYIGNGYIGRVHTDGNGIPADNQARTLFGIYPGGGAFDNDNFVAGITNKGLNGAGIDPIILSSFTKFIKAEASLSLGTTGDARTYLEEGITASIQKVIDFGSSDAGNLAPTNADVTAFITDVMTQYDAADAQGKLAIILREYYIAGFGNGIEAYNTYRKTGLPVLQSPFTVTPFPRSYILPTDETLNNTNINSNSVTDQVFWDTNPANFID